MTLEGDLAVRLAWNGRRVVHVDVHSTRPLAAPRVLATRTPDDAVALVPLLYSVCAKAQGAAAAGAIASARGADADKAMVTAREDAVVLETIQEYLWRVLIDWPRAMDEPAQIEPVAAARRAIAPALALRAPLAHDIGAPLTAPVAHFATLSPVLCRIAQIHVYGSDPGRWLANLDDQTLISWARRGTTQPARLLHQLFTQAVDLGRSDIAPMPASDRGSLAAHVVAPLRARPDFALVPDWNGAPVETGAFARLQDHRVVAKLRARLGNAVSVRMAARLVELAILLERIAAAPDTRPVPRWVDSFAPSEGEGVAAVQTARGLLLHYATIRGDRIADYRIVAPTEWNFHPQGALARGLMSVVADDEAQLVRQARISVQALDPCVACRIEVAHA